jgi:hypothetical protein
VTWQFAVEHFATRFDADYHVGPGFDRQTGEISYLVAGCKKPWLINRLPTLAYSSEEEVAVGDFPIDFGQYEVAGSSVHVGYSDLEIERMRQRPDSGIQSLAEEILVL